MVVFPAIGLLIWIAFLLVALVLSGTIWALCNLIIWLMELKPRLTRRNPAVSPKRSEPRVPVPAQPKPRRPDAARAEPRVSVRAEPKAQSDIWPKWTAARRQYMDRELSLWQEQFDALNSLK